MEILANSIGLTSFDNIMTIDKVKEVHKIRIKLLENVKKKYFSIC